MTSGLLTWPRCHHTRDVTTLEIKQLLQMTVIDVFSKYGWIVPLKTETGKEVAMAFQELFTNNAPLVAYGLTRVLNSTSSM